MGFCFPSHPSIFPFLNPDTNQQLLFFAALSAVIFLLFVALTFVLARNLLKLFAERRLGVLGSKFRTRLVVGGLLLSFLPVIMMFLFAYGLMNRSIDKWFSRPVEEVREDTAAMASLLSRYLAQNARAEAESIAALPETQRAFAGHSFSTVMSEFRRHEPTLQGGFAVAIEDGNAQASFAAPASWPLLKAKIPTGAADRRHHRASELGTDRLHCGRRHRERPRLDPGGHAFAAEAF